MIITLKHPKILHKTVRSMTKTGENIKIKLANMKNVETKIKYKTPFTIYNYLIK